MTPEKALSEVGGMGLSVQEWGLGWDQGWDQEWGKGWDQEWGKGWERGWQECESSPRQSRCQM